MIRQLLIASALLFTVALTCSNHQVHIALSDFYQTLNPSDPMLKVVFHTNKDLCADNYVLLHLDDGSTRKIAASASHFKATYTKGDYETYVHSAPITNIKFDTPYKYEIFVSDKNTFDGPFTFRVPNPHPTDKQRNFMLYGDFDSSDDTKQTMTFLKKMAKDTSKPIDAFFHIGDLAYDLEKKQGMKGDGFMEDIQDIAANIPYMVTMGNHENLNNFSNFNMRFQMPQYKFSQNHFYSLNIDNVHFVSIDLELPVLQPELLGNVVNWLEQDLKQANANRAERPWIIVYSHRPIYCSDLSDKDDCTLNADLFKPVEEVLYKYGVDIYFSGHVHTYERNLPIYKGKVMPYTKPVASDQESNYIKDPQAPLYIVEGIPGHNGYKANKPSYPVKDFCAHMDRDYSVGMISVQNNTHLLWQMLHTSDGSVADYVYLIKTKNSYTPKTAISFLEETAEAEVVLAAVSLEKTSSESSGSYGVYWIGLGVLVLIALAYFSRSKRFNRVRNFEELTELDMKISH